MKNTIIVIVLAAAIALGGLWLKNLVQENKSAGQAANPAAESAVDQTSGASTEPSATGSKAIGGKNPSSAVSAPASTPSANPTPAQNTGNNTRVFSLKDVSTHNSAASCYTIIQGYVYDLTSFISRHPGGASNIMKICGKDGTALFEGQHEGQPRPERELAGLRIGVHIEQTTTTSIQ